MSTRRNGRDALWFFAGWATALLLGIFDLLVSQ